MKFSFHCILLFSHAALVAAKVETADKKRVLEPPIRNLHRSTRNLKKSKKASKSTASPQSQCVMTEEDYQKHLADLENQDSDSFGIQGADSWDCLVESLAITGTMRCGFINGMCLNMRMSASGTCCHGRNMNNGNCMRAAIRMFDACGYDFSTLCFLV